MTHAERVPPTPRTPNTDRGVLIVNADDWGRDPATTARTLDCLAQGSVSSVSAMVFMEDSERAAAIARARGIDAGLHVNLTTPFSAPSCPRRLVDRQRDVSRYLRRSRLSQTIFHPGLMRAFDYVVAAQLDEFARLYGAVPERIDGHHHMHLCANVLLGGLLPRGVMARRNFSFLPGEKGLANRLYRRCVDAILARRHRVVDFFFSLAPLQPANRLQRIAGLARRSVVEVEVHPVNSNEFRFLSDPEIFRRALEVSIAPSWAVIR